MQTKSEIDSKHSDPKMTALVDTIMELRIGANKALPCRGCAERMAQSILDATAKHLTPWTPTHIQRMGEDRVRVVRRASISALRHLVLFENENGTFGDMTDDVFDEEFMPVDAAGVRV